MIFMIKNVIAPVQAWLLSRGQCVGCGTKLRSGNHKKGVGGLTQVTCTCKRVFLFDQKKNSYRRALMSEVE